MHDIVKENNVQKQEISILESAWTHQGPFFVWKTKRKMSLHIDSANAKAADDSAGSFLFLYPGNDF